MTLLQKAPFILMAWLGGAMQIPVITFGAGFWQFNLLVAIICFGAGLWILLDK